MRLTVHIPVYGEAEVFSRCLDALHESLWDSDFINADVLVVDDHSPDQTAILGAIDRARPRLRIEYRLNPLTPNPQLGEAVNLGLQFARAHKSTHHLNLETDVMLNTQALRYLTDTLQHPDVVAVSPAMMTPEGFYDFWYYGCREPLANLPAPITDRIKVASTNTGCLLVGKAVINNPDISVDAKRFRLWCVDGDLSVKIRLRTGKHIVLDPRAKVTHLGRQTTKEGGGAYDHLVQPAIQSHHEEFGHLLRPLFLGPLT